MQKISSFVSISNLATKNKQTFLLIFYFKSIKVKFNNRFVIVFKNNVESFLVFSSILSLVYKPFDEKSK